MLWLGTGRADAAVNDGWVWYAQRMCDQHGGGGMRARAVRSCLPLEGGAEVVGGGNLAVVFRSYMV